MSKFLYSSLISLIVLIVMFTFSLDVEAKIYKWVDENGQVHFSERPPKNKDAKQYKVNSPQNLSSNGAGLAQYEELKQGMQKQAAARTEAQQAQDKITADTEERRQPCMELREHIKKLQSGRRLTKTNDKGEKVWLDQQQSLEMFKKAKEREKTLCKGL